MKKYSCIFLFLAMLFFLIILGCGVEPDETPSLMKEIVGNYSRPGANLEFKTVKRGLIADSSTYLKINPNYTYTLYFQADAPINDSIIIIKQQGTFEIPVSRIMEGTGDWGNRYNYFYGKIYFYPKNEIMWGGVFNHYISPATLTFSPPI